MGAGLFTIMLPHQPLFVLGLSFWVGYTIATIQVEPFEEPEPSAPEAEADAAEGPR